MNVLYISNKYKVNKSEIYGLFQKYCEPEDLILRTDIDTAKDFLTDEIIQSQKHIDFIVTDWQFPTGNAKILLNWLRESNDTYSSKNFQVRSVPVLLIEDLALQSASIEKGFDETIKEFPANTLKFSLAIKSAVKKWRYNLAYDLDIIGLDPKTHKNYISHRNDFVAYHRLKILSKAFVSQSTKQLNYIWANTEIELLNEKNEDFQRKIKSTHFEKDFHRFFQLNPTFIKGEEFKDMLYEKHLYKNGTRKYDEPDFLNKPHEYSLRSPEVFEIKLQHQRIVKSEQNRFYSKTIKHFEQVKRYKKYMTSTNSFNQDIIRHYLGRLYPQYEYTLLLGSKEEKEENEDLITRLKKDFEFDDINLITYEELLEKHIRLCKRLSDFKILL